METNVNYTIVGAFVIVLLSAMIFGVIWLSSGLSSHTYAIYQVNMKESVTGLSIDSAVEFNGVNVGTVRSITISPQDPQTVVLLLNIDTTTPVTEGTTASLTSKGLTGVSYVALIDKGLNRKPLRAAAGQSYPIINTTPSLFNRFDTAMVKLNENMHQVTAAVEKLLDPDNLAAIKVSLQNIRHFTNAMVADEAQIRAVLQSTAMVAAELPGVVKSGSSMMQVVNSQTLPALNQAMSDLQEAAKNMVSVTYEIKQNPAVLLRGKTSPPLGPGER